MFEGVAVFSSTGVYARVNEQRSFFSATYRAFLKIRMCGIVVQPDERPVNELAEACR